MSRRVAAMLDAGGRALYEKVLAVKCMLLSEVVADRDPGDVATQEKLAQLAFLDPLPATRLVEEGTPFFWQNVHRLYRGDAIAFPTPEEKRLAADGVVATAFDSFFHFAPDGTTVEIEGSQGVILPRLRLKIPPSPGTMTLRRASAGALDVRCSSLQATIALDDERYAAQRFVVHDYPEAVLLTEANLLMLADSHLLKLSPRPEILTSLASMIRNSLGIIAAGDPDRSARLTSMIRYYFPIATPNVWTTHNSFSVVQLVGVIFLSESYSDLRLVEAIVHEYHHNELHSLMEGYKVLDSRADELLYSPWRPDPRPLYGLFHALHVFTGVTDFYIHALAVDELREHHDTFRERSKQICWQLRIGLAQIRTDRLSEAGLEILEAMRNELREFERAIGPLPAGMPEYQERHLQTWRGENPLLPVQAL